MEFEAVATIDPKVILQYAKKHHILSHKPFIQVVRYCKNVKDNPIIQIFKVKANEVNTKYKFGIEVPHSVKHALELDRKNNDNSWFLAIKKELDQLNEFNVFRPLGKGEKLSPEYQRIPYHVVFDVKFDLRRKARYVAGGDRTTVEKEDLYSGVVGMESVRTGFFLGELNQLSSCAADIGNAYLNSDTKEKMYIVAGL